MPDTTILGYVSIVPKGAYSPTTTYNRLNVVSYNGASYMLIVDTPTTGVTPTNGATWLQLCAPGEVTTVSAQDVAYAASDQGATPPSSGWQTAVPEVPGGGYLWTRITTTYSDSSSYSAYMVTRYGVNGTGAVSSVNGVSPDGTGNVTLTIGSISQVDSVPTINSTNLVTSGGVYTRINAVLATAQVKIQNASITLSAASWTGSGPYTQAVTIAGATAQSQINAAGSPAQNMAAQAAGYNIMFVNASGAISASCIGTKPTSNITIFVTIVELSGATGTIYGSPLYGSPVFPAGILKGNGTGATAAATLGSDYTAVDDTLSSSSVKTYSIDKIKTLGGAMYITDVAVSTTTGDIATVNNSEITANHVVAECVFANPSAITTDVTWTTSAGSLVLNGTCASATTANIVLVKKNN